MAVFFTLGPVRACLPAGRPNEAAERLENVQWTFLAKERDGAQQVKNSQLAVF